MKEVEIVTTNDAPGNFAQAVADAHAEGYVTGKEAADIVGVTYRRVDHAARTGNAPPTHEAPGGSGTIRRYDLDALVRLKIVTDLLDLGLRGVSHDLLAVVDMLEGDDPLSAYNGSVEVHLDPGAARRLIEPDYLSTINPDPKD